MTAESLRLTAGMSLRATTSGWQYSVRAVGGDTVQCNGPNGTLTVNRDELGEGSA